ncbi:MAG: hypothetical protein J6L76_05560, partial [Clostridia bacterium]|nr:hypothetical protein [Clostridia bacterium]
LSGTISLENITAPHNDVSDQGVGYVIDEATITSITPLSDDEMEITFSYVLDGEIKTYSFSNSVFYKVECIDGTWLTKECELPETDGMKCW